MAGDLPHLSLERGSMLELRTADAQLAMPGRCLCSQACLTMPALHACLLICRPICVCLQSGTVLTFTGATFVCAGELAPAPGPGQLLLALR